ncbi:MULTISPECIES: type VI secretion system contractile sheath large subunit [Gammaproteobacteria]|uniref:type VI secretion system contractile sheath large subunit n=1 Tax=Gammaproteobacteria TaxID=1236 RepID=UPI001ADC8945|nr:MULTISPECIES: type VI secretion system contractile sheath large subunit [Gammaproteobacteria]MBO9480940.1 type VI secretion system contractile sheath large subunit [Salinisphaera sp. G21_0]MBO9494521.1 type VI secretion system contractile sheath large subunit [Thalassotalea sp. G20_0]
MSDVEANLAETNLPDVFANGVLLTLQENRGQSNADDLKSLIINLVIQFREGHLKWMGNLTHTINDAVANIDALVSRQLSSVMANPDFRRLEGSWLGLQKLVRNSELGTSLKIKLFDASQQELLTQFENAPAVDRSPLFNNFYQQEFGTAGGEPYGLLVGDMYFSYSDQDITLLRYLAEVAAASHCPFIAAAPSGMFELPSFVALAEGRPVATGFDDPLYGAWNAFRSCDDARFVTLTMPRVLARLPYGAETNPATRFDFEELARSEEGVVQLDHERDFVWTNAAYELALNMTRAFSQSGWCTAIRGVDNGGRVENLPNFTYQSLSGDRLQYCPAEVNLTDEREKELSDLGFLPLVHYKGQNFAVFLGAQTAQKPQTFVEPETTANAAISARLPYVMACSRIAHYLKVMGRDYIGSNLTAEDVEKQLKNWIGQYTNPNAIGNEARARCPLRESQVSVVEQKGKPGSYFVVANLRPWLQMEELTASLRTVAAIPSS